MSGNTGGEGGLEFRAAAAAFNEGGSVYTLGEHLVAKDADSVTILITGATNFKGKDPEEICMKLINQASISDYDKLLKPISTNIRKLHDLRKVFNTFDNNAIDSVLSFIGAPGIKQLIYNNPLFKFKYASPLANLVSSLTH